MFLVELIASSFLDLISEQARLACRCKRVLVGDIKNALIKLCGKQFDVVTVTENFVFHAV